MQAAKRSAVVNSGSVPAPVGGLNARDSIANMKPTDAIILDNWVPGTTSVAIRKGYTAWSTGYASPVETLMPYQAATATKLFAASGTSIYDATSSGAVGAAVVTGKTNARWQTINFSNSGGQFMYAVNGADNALLYNGSTWVSITGVSTPAITGVNTNLFKDVQVYGRRIWFTEKNSFRVWYLPVDAIAGAATSIDLGPLFILGGSLQGMVAWQVSSEFGTTSYAAFVSSEGEIGLYAGNNPDSADTWALVGTFRVGKPVGQRFWHKVGSDIVLICEDGFIPLSKAAIMNRQSQSDAISYKITNLVNSDIDTWGSQFGWQILLYPLGNKLICNAPRGSTSDNIQYVMNTITNQWCRYTGVPSICWTLLLDRPYFGGATAVYQAETGYNDNGAAIMSDIMPAYSYFGSPGINKLFTATRPIISANGNFQPKIALTTNFNAQPPSSTPTLSLGVNGSAWDVSPWDVSSWGGTVMTSTNWQWLGGIGFAVTIRMQATTKDMSADWQSTDYLWERAKGGFF